MNLSRALKNIEKHGTLLWTRCSAEEAERLLEKMERRGYLEVNRWTKQFRLSKKGKRKLEKLRSN